jgi:hypothetical protein
MVSRAGAVFDADGRITDEKVNRNLAAFIEGFVSFVASPKGG